METEGRHRMKGCLENGGENTTCTDPIIILKCFDQTGHFRIGHVFFESDTVRSA